MKKGDIRKKEIIDTAELLFTQKGYVETSIQDILDQLNISKGSLYHHFVSKESILEEICRIRAEKIHHIVVAELKESSSSLDHLNILLSGMIPFVNEKLSFLLMILSIFSLPEGRLIRLAFNDSLKEHFAENLNRIIQEGNASGDFYCNETVIASDLIISVVNRLWNSILDYMIANDPGTPVSDLSDITRVIDYYERIIEKALNLPYGSLVLIDIPTLKTLYDQIRAHRNNA